MAASGTIKIDSHGAGQPSLSYRVPTGKASVTFTVDITNYSKATEIQKGQTYTFTISNNRDIGLELRAICK